MTHQDRLLFKATSGRFIAMIMAVFTCCWIAAMYPEQYGLRMFDFAAGLLVGYFGLKRDAPPGSGKE